jgi:transposase-like protein
MDNKLAALINLVKHMPEKCLDQAIETLENMKREAEHEEEQKPPDCPHCHAGSIVRNGHRHGKQQYLCRECGKSFVRTTGTALYNSHSGEAAWKQVIRDTVNGIPIDQTAMSLGMHHKTVFNMRHKVLFCLEGEQGTEETLSGVLEADETYILESLKGKELPEGYWRGARKHGAVSSKGGISDEYICVCAAIERGGKAYSRAVGRGKVRKEEILGAFTGKISGDALMVCDGATSYKVLEAQGLCSTAATGSGGFYRINEVNGYHSFIKERNRSARGFGTKYLNRYNALFSRVYRGSDFLSDDLYKTMRRSGFKTIAATQTEGLLAL